jgi:hypothetical protein
MDGDDGRFGSAMRVIGYYLFDMLSCVSAAITLRVCRVYIEEGFLD